MNKRKTRRSRCANETCGKQFRHADPAAKACSSNCKQVLYRHRRKAKEEAEKKRGLSALARHLMRDVKKLEAEEEAQRQAAEAEWQAAERERFAAARQAEEEERRSQPKPKRKRYPTVGIGGLGNPAPKPQVILIPSRPKRAPMTPLNRGRR